MDDTKNAANEYQLPPWNIFLLAFLVPISSLRLGTFNFTLFDLSAALFLLYYVLRGGILRFQGWIAVAYIFVLSLILASLRASNQLAALTHIGQWIFIFVVTVPLVYSMSRSLNAKKYLVAALVLAVVIIDLDGIYELFQLLTSDRTYRYYRVTSIFDNAQLLGFHVAVLMPFLLVGLRSVRGIVGRKILSQLIVIFLIVIVGATIVLLLYSLSRTGLLATAAAVLCFFVLDNVGVRYRKEIWRRTLFVVAFFAIMSCATALLANDPALLQRLRTRYASSLDLSSEEVADRTMVWQEALSGVNSTYYLVGVGPDNYQYISRFSQKPHNVFLLFLVEGGIITLLAYSSLLAYFFIKTVPPLFRQSHAAPFTRIFLVATVSSMVAYLVVGMFNTQTLLRLYWFMYAAGLAAASDVSVQCTPRIVTADT